MRVLFLAPAFPAPPLRGFQARAFHQLRLLGGRHRITLLASCDRPPDAAALGQVGGFCERVVTVPFRRPAAAVAALRGLPAGRPLQAAVHEQPALRGTLGRLLASGDFDLLHAQLARIAGVPGDRRTVPGVLDLVDALSLNMARRAAVERGPLGRAAAFEARRLAAFERACCRAWDRVTVATEEDRAAIGDFPSLRVNPNGVDLDGLPFSAAPRPPGSIVFTGNLGYFPNRDAARWFAEAVLPLVLRERPDAVFTAAGARPPRSLRALAAARAAVRLAADPPDLRPHLAGASVAVAPLRAGTGHPLKVLEAMALGTPVVATPLAAAGIGAEPGRHLLVAEDAAAFAAAVLRLLGSPALAAGIAAAARRLVEERHGWPAVVAGLERVWEEAAGARP